MIYYFKAKSVLYNIRKEKENRIKIQDWFIQPTIYDLHRQMNISLELNKFHLSESLNDKYQNTRSMT